MEKTLVKNLVSYLKKKGHRVKLEVPFLYRSIDIVYKTKRGELVAIEVKMDHCKKALDQAKYCLLGASRVYVCLPKRKITCNIREKFLNMDIGLIHANKRSNDRHSFKYKYVIRANKNLNRYYKKIFKEAFLKKVSKN